MLVLEALGALWFWTSFLSHLALPSTSVPVLPSVVAAEMAWHAPEEAWSNPLVATVWKAHWLQRTGCCVDFVSDPAAGGCAGSLRLVHVKTLAGAGGWRTGFVVASCG